ncbi:MAG: hypothetical protein PHE84_01715 [bacterium]|nr:hypothetical protein [bacterium]
MTNANEIFLELSKLVREAVAGLGSKRNLEDQERLIAAIIADFQILRSSILAEIRSHLLFLPLREREAIIEQVENLLTEMKKAIRAGQRGQEIKKVFWNLISLLGFIIYPSFPDLGQPSA